MPVFGKSGTWRMRDFKASHHVSQLIEKPVALPDGGDRRLDARHDRSRAPGGPRRSARSTRTHRLVVSLDQGLDAAIRSDCGRSRARPRGAALILNEEPETDALHAPADQESLRDDHGNGDYRPAFRVRCNAPGASMSGPIARATVRGCLVLGASSQGESRLRMLRIVRRGDRHDPRDLTVSVPLRGRFRGRVPRRPCRRHHSGRDAEEIRAPGRPATMQAPRSRCFGLALCQRHAGTRIDRLPAYASRSPSSRGRGMEVGGKARGKRSPSAVPSSGPRR